ncbi:MAG: ScyD/ScyE family protein [Thermomicrobiales bacterium]|nr:ScyD/ScyE family protein [Thermomicrobiales bacterium]MCO5222723.1 ScyD/ScyE family protein [Thermomicrobiales bacterium]
MSRFRKSLGLVAAGALVAGGMLGASLGTTVAQDPSPVADGTPVMEGAPALPAGCTVAASGLDNPRFVAVSDGIVYVSVAGSAGDEAIFATAGEGTPAPADPVTMYGPSGAVIAVNADGTVSTVAGDLPSFTFGTEVVGPAGLDVANGVLYVATGGVGPATGTVPPLEGRAAVWSIDLVSGEGTIVADLEAYEMDNNPDPHMIDADPYGLVVGTDGMVYVADAGGNDILKVDPTTGEVSTLAVIPGLPGQAENPTRGGALEIDPVPTGLALAPDGGLYVSTLSGGPFIPGTAALLHVAMDGTVTTVASGLTMLGDVTVGPDGAIYVVTMSDNFIDPAGPAPGSIVRVNEDGTSTPVISGIPFPNSIAFDADGNAYITAMVSVPAGTPASGMVLKCDAAAFAAAVASPEATPAG